MIFKFFAPFFRGIQTISLLIVLLAAELSHLLAAELSHAGPLLNNFDHSSVLAGFDLIEANLAAAGQKEKSLSSVLYKKIPDVADFLFIRKSCMELGLRCWLNGETAALYGSYVRRALQAKETGNPKIFNYNFIDIYGSGFSLAQLAIDGDAEAAKRLRTILNQRLSHSIADPSNRSSLEPRSFDFSTLSWSVQPASAVESPDHLDSYSTAAIELTRIQAPSEPKSEPVKNLEARETLFTKELESEGNRFHLRDEFPEPTGLSENEIENLLPRTARFLGHCFKQHQMPSQEDQAWIRLLVSKIDPNRLKANRPLLEQFVKEATAFVVGNPEIEKSRDVLQFTGVQSLIEQVVPIVDRTPELGDTNPLSIVGFWGHQNVMKSKSIGSGDGKLLTEVWDSLNSRQTQIFLTHSTHTLPVFESMLASDDGHPNAFLSGGAGWNNGIALYTFPGFTQDRARYGRYPLRLWPENEQVRQSSDFVDEHTGIGSTHYVLAVNRQAFRVQSPDYSKISILDLLKDVSSSNVDDLVYNSDPSKGPPINYHLALLYAAHAPPLSAPEEAQAVAIVQAAIDRQLTGVGDLNILKVWFALPMSSKHPEILDRLRASGEETLKLLRTQPELFSRLQSQGDARAYLPSEDQEFMRESLPIVRRLADKTPGT